MLLPNVSTFDEAPKCPSSKPYGLARGAEGGRVTSGIRTHDIQNHNLTL